LLSHVTALVAHPALERLLVEELPEQYGVEVIPGQMSNGKILAGFRGAAVGGQGARR